MVFYVSSFYEHDAEWFVTLYAHMIEHLVRVDRDKRKKEGINWPVTVYIFRIWIITPKDRL
jgi:hypothetical protein